MLLEQEKYKNPLKLISCNKKFIVLLLRFIKKNLLNAILCHCKSCKIYPYCKKEHVRARDVALCDCT